MGSSRVLSVRRIAAGCLIVQALALISGALYQAGAHDEDRSRFSPPGVRYGFDGYVFHLDCTGPRASGRPLVVLEGGLGAPGLMWTLVQPRLAARVRVCSYDRAGYGWSEPGPGPRTARRMATELHQLLQAAGEAPPYLLVGHSFGGILIRVYTAEFPDDVAGLVLVDARHERLLERIPAALEVDQRNYERTRWLRWLTPFGVTRIAGRLGWLDELEAYLAPLPDEQQRAAWALMVYDPGHWATALAEREAIDESYRQAVEARLPPALPLVVLTAEHGDEAWRSPDEPPEAEDHATWMALQRELAALTANSRWVIVEGSGHYIYFDQPQAIVDAVVGLLDD
jgi:pimeloyl-ACP methyl ester carboxylesterase